MSLPRQFLMEGAYNRVILSRSNVPADSYTFFIDLLLLTIRCAGAPHPRNLHANSHAASDEIGECAEAAFATLPYADAARLLFIDRDADLQAFIQSVRVVPAGASSTSAARLDGCQRRNLVPAQGAARHADPVAKGAGNALACNRSSATANRARAHVRPRAGADRVEPFWRLRKNMLLAVAALAACLCSAEHEWVTRETAVPFPTTASVVTLAPEFSRSVRRIALPIHPTTPSMHLPNITRPRSQCHPSLLLTSAAPQRFAGNSGAR